MVILLIFDKIIAYARSSDLKLICRGGETNTAGSTKVHEVGRESSASPGN